SNPGLDRVRRIARSETGDLRDTHRVVHAVQGERRAVGAGGKSRPRADGEKLFQEGIHDWIFLWRWAWVELRNLRHARKPKRAAPANRALVNAGDRLAICPAENIVAIIRRCRPFGRRGGWLQLNLPRGRVTLHRWPIEARVQVIVVGMVLVLER